MNAIMAKQPNRTGVPLQLYVPPWVKDVLAGMAEDGRRSLTNEVLTALEAHIRAAGRWSPPVAEADEKPTAKRKKGGKP